MPEWVNEVLASAQPYWSALAQVLVFWFLGQNLKKRVWTKARAQRGGFHGFMRATMWGHAMLLGVGWGSLYPWMPAVDFVTTRGGAVTQGLISGVVAVAGYRLLEAVAQARKWITVLKFLREAGSPSMVPPVPSKDDGA